MPKKRSTIWKMHEWEYLAKLLYKGYPLIECLRILQKDTREIEDSMRQGLDVQQGICTHAPAILKRHLLFFLTVTSFSSAIRCSIRMAVFEKEIKKKLKKQTAYPLFIFYFAYITLAFFLHLIIPQLLLGFSEEMTDMFFMTTLFFLKLIYYGITCLSGGALIFFIVCKIYKIPEKYLPYLFRIPLCKEYISYVFACYLKELEEEGLSTKRAIFFLISLKDRPMFVFFAKSLQQAMEEGKDLSFVIQKHPYVCDTFRMNFSIGEKTGTLKECLEDYIVFQEERWMLLMRRMSVLIQTASYGFVGCLVIMVYQILLVPLQLLETM